MRRILKAFHEKTSGGVSASLLRKKYRGAGLVYSRLRVDRVGALDTEGTGSAFARGPEWSHIESVVWVHVFIIIHYVTPHIQPSRCLLD